MNTNIGTAGEFRCVVKRADGSIKTDTGYQKNLILDQGLDFFGGGNSSDMMEFCVIGSGNSKPVYTQNKLDVITDYTNNRSGFSSKYDYDASKDGNLYKTNKVIKYTFNGLSNVNISEVGLASEFSSTTDYYLCTRALIKDAQGVPATITVLSDEVLEIYYKLWQVFDTTDKVGTINLLDGVGGSVAYNYKLRLCVVGSSRYSVGGLLKGNLTDLYALSSIFTGDLDDIKGIPSGLIFDSNSLTLSTYNRGSYRRTILCTLTHEEGVGNIRTYVLGTTMGAYQIRFGSVADDSPITKTNAQTLTIPVEVSWGRYEGAL